MSKRRLAIVCLLLCWLISCSSSSKSPVGVGQSGLVFTSPTVSPSIDVGQSVTLIVSEASIFTLKPGTGFYKPVGTLNNTTTATTSVTYSVPMTTILGAPAQDEVVATSASDATSTANIVVIVNPPVSLQTTSSHLTANTDCSYNPVMGNSDGTVGGAYVPNAEVGSLQVVGGTAPYTWSVTSGAPPAGLTLQALTGSKSCGNSPSCVLLEGTPVTSACSQLTVQVTDAAGMTATSPNYFVVITPPPLKVQVPLYTDLYQGVPYPPTALSVAGGVAPYSWQVADPLNFPLPAGINLTAVAQNTASAYLSGTPQPTNAFTPTLLVTDNQNPYPAVGQTTLNFNEWTGLTAPCTPGQSFFTANNAMQGSYAFLLRGFDATGPVVMAGSFAADGAGNVTGGVEDVMRSTGSQAGVAIDAAHSSYTIFEQVGDNGNFATRGCASLAAGGTTTTFSFTLGGCTTTVGNFGLCGLDSQNVQGLFTTGRVIEFDSGGQLSGIIRRQDTSAFSTGLSGAYAFGLSGRDSSGGRFASAGFLDSSKSTAAADINDAGALQSNLTGGTASAGSFDVNGRGTLALSVGTAAFNLAAYEVSAHDVLLASIGTASAANPLVSGEAISTSAPFNQASLENTHLFHIAGLSSNGADPSIGTLSFDGTGFYTGTQFEDDAGTLSTTSLSGTYIVDSASGRFTMINQNSSVVVHPLVGYAIPESSTLTRANCVQPSNCVTGFLLSTDTSAQAGLLEFQTPTIAPPPPFSNLYVTGYYFYGTDESLDSTTPVFEGATNAIPNNASYSGIVSASYPSTSFYCSPGPCTSLLPNLTLSTKGSYSVSTIGTGSLGGESAAVTNGNVIFYLDESPLNSHPAVMVAEQ